MIIAFVVSICICTVLCTIIWQECITDNLYYCTDPLWLDFLLGPNHWVHANTGDTIKDGWTMGRLQALWLTFIALSMTISAMIAWRFRPRPRWNAGA